MKKPEEWSLGYALLRHFVSIFFKLTHRHFTINGLENIPNNQPIIFAPNHQNALLDPLAIIFSSPIQPVFLARADIFKKRWIARILTFIKILPVYRIRDGKETLDKNQEVFNSSIRILNSNKMLCLFPEGAHTNIKSMLPHKKAIPRIVFIAAEKTNSELDINIVPVGINYTNYYHFRRSITINFGKAISTKAYYDILAEQGETKATVALRDDLFEAVKQLIVHVDDRENYAIYEQGFEMMHAHVLGGPKTKIKNFTENEQWLSSKIATQLNDASEKEKLNTSALRYKKLKTKLNFTEKDLAQGKIGFFGILKALLISAVLLPISLLGAIINGWLFYLTRYPYRKKIKDPQFFSSVSFVLSLLLFPIWYIILFFLLNLMFDNAWLSVILIVLSIPSGIIGFELGQFLIRTAHRIKFTLQSKKKHTAFVQMLSLREELKMFYKRCI